MLASPSKTPLPHRLSRECSTLNPAAIRTGSNPARRLIAFGWLLAVGLTAAEATLPPGIISAGIINGDASYPSSHASTIVATADGNLAAAWFGGTAERNPDVGIWLSRREGGRWLPATEVATGVQSPTLRLPTWNPVLFQPRQGPLMLFYKVGATEDVWWGEFITSTDSGRTWSKPQRLPKGILGPIKNKPVQLADGTILSPTSVETPDEPSKWMVYFERSTDLGKTWTSTAQLNDGVTITAIQPSILFHGGEKLQALGRTRQGKIFDLWSQDNGKTWGPMTLTSLPNPDAGTDAVTLADGRHLLVYNHSTKAPGSRGGGPRYPLNVAISKDGIEWRQVLTLEDKPIKHGYAYPAVIQAPDGLVHITYTWNRERIKHVVLDLKKLP